MMGKIWGRSCEKRLTLNRTRFNRLAHDRLQPRIESTTVYRMNTPGTDMLAKSRELTEERFARRNKLSNGKRRPRPFCGTPLGRKVTAELFLKPMADFMAGNLNDKPPSAPGDLGSIVYKLNY